MKDVRLLSETFNPGVLVGSFTDANPGLGGVCSFVGEVRGDDAVEALELSHYEPLTLAGMNDLADQALARFGLMGILIVHRVGQMRVGEPIVLVSAAARHRREAIQAVDFTMDHLKSDAWFWKRELRKDGWHWIEPRDQDHADLARWQDGAAGN
ncbi:molybdopterin synthase catalytic subunit [Altererythrobacter atlanticus]|uniref:Molybdopterin synthase catalytic subunit n=1 Tax=Croceibacterium atlanticum TaxID=1267766 RepID=A0A0F7KP62_9SPHN|nr:molybdenum cofactor biosynthesis protein MoaE [Croceibacterium atlanticum]AKH42313.1 Molybdopterin synthase catalytic subunit [Croceibacterium atlanticum]MBB5731090.1 molybdopterin synthase catalytic subunit [Croceibacterium atlanticum]